MDAYGVDEVVLGGDVDGRDEGGQASDRAGRLQKDLTDLTTMHTEPREWIALAPMPCGQLQRMILRCTRRRYVTHV